MDDEDSDLQGEKKEEGREGKRGKKHLQSFLALARDVSSELPPCASTAMNKKAKKDDLCCDQIPEIGGSLHGREREGI